MSVVGDRRIAMGLSHKQSSISVCTRQQAVIEGNRQHQICRIVTLTITEGGLLLH